MTDATHPLGAEYAALRCDLIEVLSEQSAQGRFAWMTQDGDQTRATLFLSDLARAIADILITACPNNAPDAHAAALADAVVLASWVRELPERV